MLQTRLLMPLRKRMAEALTGHRTQTSGILDQIEDAVIVTHMDGVIRSWNVVAERLYGFTADEAVGQSIAMLYFPEDLDALATEVIAPVRDKGSHAVELRNRRRDGSEVYVEVRLSLERTADGAPTGVIGCSHDVTARRRAALELLRNKEELRVILDTMPAMVWYKDRDNRILRANRSAAKTVGLTPTAIEGRSTYDLFPDHAERYHRDDLDVIRSGAPKLGIIEKLLNADGDDRWVRTDKIPYRDAHGEIIGVIVFAIDITDQKNAEAALAHARDQLEQRVQERTQALAEAIGSLRSEIAHRQQAEQRLELALWASDLGMWDWDGRTGEAVCDARWAEMLGYRPDEVTQPTQLWESLSHPDDAAVVRQAWQAHVVENRVPQYHVEQRLRTKSGEYRWMLSRGKVVERDAAGRALRMTGTILDVTARKAIEAQGARHQAELAHILRLETVNLLAAELAHEINQPLGAIVNFANGLASRLRQGIHDGPAMLEAADEIGRQAMRAATVLQRLRDFVRKDTAPAMPCDVNRLVEAAATFVGAEARRAGVTLDLDLADGLPPVLGDAIQIEQVIVNLLRNGLDAIIDGAGAPGALAVATAAAPAGGVEVRVRDSGAGVPAAVRERLFEPFFTTKSSGLGMGLSISRSIVDAHGGRLWLEDGSGPGTTFCFSLPASR